MTLIKNYKYVLFSQRVHELRKYVRLDDGLCQIVVVTGEPADGQRRGLLDRWDRIQKERPELQHDAGVLQDLDVLRAGREVGHRLHELHPTFLVLLEY